MSGGGTGVTGSSVTLYAAGSSGYGTNAITLGTTTSDSSGNFSMSFSPADPAHSCPSGNTTDQTYVVATGGNAGGGTNSAIALMALTGPCGSLSSTTFVVTNELTTAAAQWAMAQFLDSSGKSMGTSSTNATGLNNSVNQSESDLVVSYLASGGSTSNVGIPASFMPSAALCSGGSPPVNCDGLERLDMLANIIAACDQSSGPSSTPCSTLFSNTGNSGNTLAAARTAVTNPASNVSAIFGVQQTPSTSAPYQPTFSSAPGDLTLGLNFAPAAAAFEAPGAIALDSTGNVFVANQVNAVTTVGSVSELTAASGYTAGSNFAPAAASFLNCEGIALDTSGNVFVANQGDGSSNFGSVSELTAGSSYGTGLNFTPAGAAFLNPDAIGLDSSGNVFVANSGNNVSNFGSVSELTASSSYATGLNFAPAGASFNNLFAMALDSTGNVFVVNSGPGGDSAGSVSELTASSSYGTGFNFAPSGAAFDFPESIALDNSANVFVTNDPGSSGGSVSELTASSSYGTGLNFTPAGASLTSAAHIALDSSGNIIVLNVLRSHGNVSELTAGSGYATGFNFVPGGAVGTSALGAPLAAAIDGSGNVFLAMSPRNGGSVSELVGLVTPVLTPVQACLIKGHNICLP